MGYNHRAVMADIYENRRARLRQILEERFEGNQLRLAKAVDLSRPGIRTALIGSSNLGEYAARRIEKALGLGHGWFDREPPRGAVLETPYKARMGRPPIQDGIVRPKRKSKRPQRVAA